MDACVTCGRPLVFEINSDDEEQDPPPASNAGNNGTVPDSVELTCGCHFHWECLLDAYSLNTCPNCNATITSTSSTNQEQILCNLNNEGGLQEGLDILPLLVEASYLKTYPEERRGRAFVELAGEGDVTSIDMLKEDTDESEGEAEIDLLRYQDPIAGMSSALHAAISGGHTTVAWLLLWLGSGLGTGQFPPEIVRHAQELALSRNNAMEKGDIRALQDGEGMTAQQRAAASGGVWTEWLNHGWLQE